MSVDELADGKLRLDRPAPHVARLTIDNPAKRNALDHAILDAIATTMRELDDARCLLLTAAGPVFSAGYDIGGLPRDEFAHRAESLVAHPFHDAIAALDAFPYPAVAALNGHAIGGGLELALTCDLRLAAESAKLGMPPAKLGLVYSHTGPAQVHRRDRGDADAPSLLHRPQRQRRHGVGVGHGQRGRPGRRARRARGRLRRRDRRQRAALAGGQQARDPRAAGRRGQRSSPRSRRELVALREACFRTDDFYEGVRAFAEKRPPQWQGR